MVKIGEVKELKFSVGGVDVAKTGKVYSISGEDKKNKIRFMENESFKCETRLDTQGRIVEDRFIENGVSSIVKFEYAVDGTVYEKHFDKDGNVTCEKVTTKEGDREVTKDNAGQETVIEIFKDGEIKIRKITRNKNGKVYETVERHCDENNKPVYSRTEHEDKPVIESWCDFDENGYCSHQKVCVGSEVTEYRNEKSDDGKFVVMYEKTGDKPEKVLGITELLRTEELSAEIHYHIA